MYILYIYMCVCIDIYVFKVKVKKILLLIVVNLIFLSFRGFFPHFSMFFFFCFNVFSFCYVKQFLGGLHLF